MKHQITIETSDIFELHAIIDAGRNKANIDCLYEMVFRKYLRHMDLPDEQLNLVQDILYQVNEHFEISS